MRLLRRTLVVAACLLAFPGSAVAAPTLEAEPNENVFELTGPISPDGATGTLATVTDVDEYLVQFRPDHHVKLLFSLLNAGTPECPLAPTGSKVHYLLRAPDAIDPYVVGDLEVGTEFVDVLDKTTPGEQGDPSQPLDLTFSAVGDDAAGCSYRFTVTDSGGHATDAIDPTPLPEYADVTPPEPNSLPEQAFGPLAGNTSYFGTIDGEGDVDRMRAWLFPGQQVTVELGAVAPGCGDCKAAVTIEDPLKNVLLPPLTALPEQVVSAPIVGTAAEALIGVSGKAGTRWRLRLSPPEAILPAAPGGSKPRAPRKQYKSGVTLRRGVGSAVRYLGQVTSAGGAVCRSKRLVVLRHAGSGLKRFSITRTRADGSFTVSRQTRTGGTVYVAVVEKVTPRRLCRFARSPRVRA